MEIFSLNFMQNAFLAGFLVSIACGIIGSLTIINKMTFIAGGVAHGAYGGLGIAFFLGINALLGATLFSIALALLIAFITLKNSSRTDSVIGALWAFGMAVGIVFIDITPGYNVDLMSYLFGSILAVPRSDLYFMFFVDILFLVFVVVCYRQLCAISFDKEFALLRGVRVALMYYILVVMMALCVVVTIGVVGLILVIALLTIPPYISEKFCKNLATMMILATILSTIFCFLGLFLSYHFNLTSGASIILVATLSFFCVEIWSKITKNKSKI